MLLQIDGWFASGKSVLLSLLDGHSNIFASPVHDFSYVAFLTESNELDWVTTRHTEILRKALARTQYFKFEKVYLDGYRTFDFSTKEILNLPYTINFYSFDKKIFTTLSKLEEWSLELISNTIYESVYEHSPLANASNNPLFFASLGNPTMVEYYKKMPLLFPSGKSIQIKRDIIDLIAIRSNRKPHINDFKTKSFFSDSFEKRIKEGEVEKILRYYDVCNSLEKEFPEFFMSVDFKEIISNTENTMRGISSFLQIPFSDELLKCTFLGNEIVCNGKKYIGQENDNVNELLSKDEIRIIEERIERYYEAKVH